MAGARDAAIEHLAVLLNQPAPYSVQLLRLDPRWDGLRDEPKCRDLVAQTSLQP
jgi:hypothetical protein